jgi:hypothetical protein
VILQHERLRTRHFRFSQSRAVGDVDVLLHEDTIQVRREHARVGKLIALGVTARRLKLDIVRVPHLLREASGRSRCLSW